LHKTNTVLSNYCN